MKEPFEITDEMIDRAVRAYKSEMDYKAPEVRDDPYILRIVMGEVLFQALYGEEEFEV